MWVRFLEPYLFHVSARVSLSYRAGCVYNVPRACGQAAIAAGKAEVMRKQSRSTRVEIANAQG